MNYHYKLRNSPEQRSSQGIKLDREIGLNQSLISIHHFLPLSPQLVLLSPLQLSSKRKYYVEEILERVFTLFPSSS